MVILVATYLSSTVKSNSYAKVCVCVCVCMCMCAHCVCVYVCLCAHCVCVCVCVRALSRRVNHTSLILTTENVFQAISPGVKTLGLPAPSTRQLLTKDGVLNQAAVGCVVTSAVQLGRGQIPASVSSHLTKI